MKLNREQLAKLSKEEKLKLLDLVEEKKRRKREARVAFKPHPGQQRVIKDKHPKRIVISGNGFGKTALGVNEALWALEGFNPITNEHTPVPAKVIVALDSPDKVADVWLPELRKWRPIREDQLSKNGKPYYTRIAFDNGSELRFMFFLQEELAFESIEADFVVIDEPPTRNIWVALLRSGRRKNRHPRFLLIGTPISQPWLREYFVEWEKGHYPDTNFFKGSTEENKDNLAKGYLEEFSRHLTEREKATRLHGNFFNTDGLALADLFKRERHVRPATALPADWKSWPAVVSVDPHPNKPTHACLLIASPTGELIYAAERAVKEVPRDWARWLKANWMQEFNVVDLVCDNFGSGDYTGGEGFKSFIEVWNSEGVRIRATTFDEKKDDEFLTRLQDALYIPEQGTPKLIVLSSCVGVIRDMENVQWKPVKGTETYAPKLEIGNKDFLACLKYALATNLTFGSAKRKVIRPPGWNKPRMQPRKPGAFEVRWRNQQRKKMRDDDW